MMTLLESVEGSNLPNSHKAAVIRALKSVEAQMTPSRALVGVMIDLQRKHGADVRLPVSLEAVQEVLARVVQETPVLDITTAPDGGAEIRLAWRPKTS